MKIGELAKRSDCPVKTIRYYEEIGLLDKAARDYNGYRNYDDTALQQLKFIKSAQAAGLSLKEISEVLLIRKSGRPPCHHVQHLLTKHADSIETKLVELQNTKAELQKLISYSLYVDPEDCEDESICVILNSNHDLQK